MKRFLILTALLLASGQADAAFYSTSYLKQLLDSCNALPGTFEANKENFSSIKDCGLSTGYILGVFDNLNVMADRSRCFPHSLKSEQVVAAVENWIRNNPDRGQEPADRSVNSAISEAWRCPDQ
ncbi:Rap1a/Tai family immunity protein [Pseudomonadota bacterium]